MNHGTAFYHDDRCLLHTTGEAVLGACHWAAGCSRRLPRGHPEHS